MTDLGRSWMDRLPALTVTLLLGGYGLIGIFGLLQSAGGHGMSGIVIFPIVASLYAAAAVLQWEFRIVRVWEPGLRQGAGATWVGAWTFVLVVGSVRLFLSGGIAAVGDFIGGAAFFWCLFVGLPLLLAYFRSAAPREEHRGFIND